MKRPLTACMFAVLMTTLPLSGQAQDITSDTVVARVGEVEITMGHVIQMRQQLPQQYANLPDDVLFEGIVEQLVDQQLLSDQVDFDALPLANRLKIDNERRALLASETIGSFMARPIDETEVQAAYDEAYANVEPEQEFNASHILVETEEEAQALVEELDGDADFAELAKEKSTGPSGPNGGQLGWFGKGAMVPEFEAAVLELEPGGISAPVKTQFGWHVVRLNEVRDVPLPTLDEARGQIEQNLRQQNLNAFIAGLREGDQVEMLIDGISPDVVRNDAILSGE